MPKKKVNKKVTKKIALRPVVLFTIVAFLFLLFCIMYKKDTFILPSHQNQQMMFEFGNQLYQIEDTQRTATVMNQSISPDGTRAAAIIVDSPEGSGVFYYLVGASIKNGAITYSEPVLLGDRIKIVDLAVNNPGQEDNGLITVIVLNRPAEAPMSVEPIEKATSQYAIQDNGNLMIVLP